MARRKIFYTFTQRYNLRRLLTAALTRTLSRRGAPKKPKPKHKQQGKHFEVIKKNYLFSKHTYNNNNNKKRSRKDKNLQKQKKHTAKQRTKQNSNNTAAETATSTTTTWAKHCKAKATHRQTEGQMGPGRTGRQTAQGCQATVLCGALCTVPTKTGRPSAVSCGQDFLVLTLN